MEMLHEAEFWEAVGFVLVIAILVWKGVPGLVGKMLDQRAAAISAELNEARRLREEVRTLKERIAVLERLATDDAGPRALEREIEALRSRDS